MFNSTNQPKLEHHPTPTAIEWTNLVESERLLLKILEDLRFGRIESLIVCGGKPLLQPPPRIIVRFNTDEPPDPTEGPKHLGLRRPLIRLFELMRQIGNGTILVIHVKHGLPVAVEFERQCVG